MQLLGEEVLVPSAVAVEIQQRGVEDPTVAALSQTNWLTVVEAPPTPEIIQSWDLGKGESSSFDLGLYPPRYKSNYG